MKIIEFKNVHKSFEELEILKGVNFSIDENKSIAIIGKSGSGKSTLLHLAGGLDTSTEGKVFVNGNDWSELSDKSASNIRNTQIGYIFQSNLLLDDFSVLENTIISSLIAGKSKTECIKRAVELLTKLGLEDRLDQKASKLSGGEKQRVSICRALMNRPKIILADEPTGSLDESNAQDVENMLFSLIKEEGCSLLLVTHNPDFANRCEEVYQLKMGKLEKVDRA